MITLTDVLRVQEHRVRLGFAVESGNPEDIDCATAALVQSLCDLRCMIDAEMADLLPQPQPVQALEDEHEKRQREAAIAYFQTMADQSHQTLMLLDKRNTNVHGIVPAAYHVIDERDACEWQRKNAVAILSPKLETVHEQEG